ncbi:dynactin subunit [Diplocarpon rosae]|nr:dynactin subunit [Diplocarpon rosae]
MTSNRKYAALPDLDSAPDLYETPELTDDNSTALTGIARSESASSSYKDFDEDEDEAPGISRSRLHLNEARNQFAPAQIDARDVDFSDRVTAKRKSYKASTRRHRKKEDGTEEHGDFSDDEDGESLERKVARLRREIEEVKEECGKRQAARQGGDELESVELSQDVTDLNKMLDGISLRKGPTSKSAGGKFAKDLGTGIKANGPPQTAQGIGEATYTITYAPTYQQSHALAKAADFDGRLALLEKALGISAAELPSSTGNALPKAILPTLDTLQRQISVILESTPASLDSVGRRVRSLVKEAEDLEIARKRAKVAQDELRASGGDGASDDGEDSEQVAKINALYGTLPTIENIAPLLPSLLERLRSLRAIHADAATASVSLDRVEKQQTEMAADIKKWREGLERVEEALKQGETVSTVSCSLSTSSDEAEDRAVAQVDDVRAEAAAPRKKHSWSILAGNMSQWQGQAHVKGSSETMRMALLTFSLVGLQFTWGIEMTYCTPYLLSLGLTKSKTSLVWIAGPISGLIMQPIVGVIADRSTSKYGRRRPFMVVGSFVVGACLMALGWAKEIVACFVEEGEFRKTCTVALAVLSIYAIDFAINAGKVDTLNLAGEVLTGSQFKGAVEA